MKPLTSETLAKAAIIEGYCWEIAAHEVANKNTTGAQYFMGLADSLHAMYELGHDGEEAPSLTEALDVEIRLPTYEQMTALASRQPPAMPQPVSGVAIQDRLA